MYLILVKCFHNIVNIETKLFGVSKMSKAFKKIPVGVCCLNINSAV